MNRGTGVSTGALLVGSLLHDEFKNLGREIWRRGRKRGIDYILGPPSYRGYSPRKMVDRSLGRIRSVRRASTKRRLTRGRYAKRYRTRTRPKVRRYRARRAMGTNGPAFRSRMRRTRYRVELGERMGFMPSRKHMATGSTTSAVDKVLHATRLVNIPYSDTDNVMNTRVGRLCDVTGVKFRAWISLKSNIIESSVIWSDPIQVRWAVINPRENTGELTDVTNGNNFFMSDSPAADDTDNFPSTGNCFKYMNRKINSRRYGVLQEGSFLLSNDPAATNTRVNPRSKKFISFYVPIKRQMKWANNGTATEDAFPNANIQFVWWFVKQGDKDTAQVYAANTPFDYHNERITYFKNAEALVG